MRRPACRSSAAGRAVVTGPAPACPVCGRPGVVSWRPFCSRRCADVDLGRWFNEAYRIPAEPAEPADGDGDADADPETGT